jgi:hypothetical protein
MAMNFTQIWIFGLKINHLATRFCTRVKILHPGMNFCTRVKIANPVKNIETRELNFVPGSKYWTLSR